MKDSKIAADLAGYLRTIMPSTLCEAVVADGRHGVRVQLRDDSATRLLLHRTHWVSASGTLRIAVGETYPVVTMYVAHSVAAEVAAAAHVAMMVPLDGAAEVQFEAYKAQAATRVHEAVLYLEQVAHDPGSTPKAVFLANRALETQSEHVRSLRDRRRNPGPGAPTPAGTFSG